MSHRIKSEKGPHRTVRKAADLLDAADPTLRVTGALLLNKMAVTLGRPALHTVVTAVMTAPKKG
mgnify:CR=1 FL=1